MFDLNSLNNSDQGKLKEWGREGSELFKIQKQTWLTRGLWLAGSLKFLNSDAHLQI